MIVDTSALIAILQDEPESPRLLRAASNAMCQMSAANLVEAGIVADGRSALHGERLDVLLVVLEIDVIPVSARHAELARAAHRRYGRGSGSPAKLNFGDCFSYALASETGLPLLFVGEDFAETDVLAATY